MPTATIEDQPIVRVNFDFRRELARKVEGNLSNFCYQCGACVGDCPAAAYSGAFNPREIMLKVLYGLGSELLKADSVLWYCTNCYNCHERCPQQVKPVEVIISLKNMLADRGIYPNGVEKIIKAVETTGRTTTGGSVVDRQREQYGLPPLRAVPVEEIQKLIEPVENGEVASAEEARVLHAPGDGRADFNSSEAPARVRTEVRAPETKRVAFFPGCLIPARYPAIEFAIRQTLPKLGIEIVDLQGTSCCPDPIYFKSKDKLSWLAIAARNLTLAEEQGLDIFTNCSGCTATLSEAHHLLEDDTLRAKTNARLRRIGRQYLGQNRVRHIVTLVRDVVGYEAVRRSVVRPLTGLKVAIHYGCHLLKPSRIMNVDDPNNPTVLENLVTALGATPVRHRNWYLCCGKACQAEDVPANMMRDLLSTVNAEQADLMCLVCPTCFGQFDYGQVKIAQQFGADFHTPPAYYFQLLAFAQGVPYDKLGFERQRLKPEVLRRFETT
ncbi:MAG: 4Fe-4S dicluster domain-containing protein [Verrucomicrobia bacterium]|nr:4Fe-4S dicluster domain-containing protein [Verrucomicrobiota bacterium]